MSQESLRSIRRLKRHVGKRCVSNNRSSPAATISRKSYAGWHTTRGLGLIHWGWQEGGEGFHLEQPGRRRAIAAKICYSFRLRELRRIADRWQSGRMYLTRNQAYVQAYRGFESHPVRHRIFQSSPKKTKDPVETSIYGVFCFQGGPTASVRNQQNCWYCCWYFDAIFV